MDDARMREAGEERGGAAFMTRLVDYAGGKLSVVNAAVAEARRGDGTLHLADVVEAIDRRRGATSAAGAGAETGD